MIADLATGTAPESCEKDWSETEVLQLLATMTYDQVHHLTGWSRGRIYKAATRHGARKNEERIKMRHVQRAAEQVEFLREVLNTTVRADVLDYLAGLPDDSVDLVLTSPPYNLGKKYGNGASAMDLMRFSYYAGWLACVMSEAERILRPGATLCLQLGQTMDETGNLFPLDVLVFDSLRRMGLKYQSRIVWTFGHGLTPKRRLAERYETMLVLSKGEQQTFNSLAARTPQKEPGKRAFKGPRKGQLSGCYFGAAPTNVWAIPQVGHNHPEKTGHPCQFPLALAKRAIMLYTNAGALVVDPFSGSGTTHAACIQTGRAFSGADITYEDERRTRLAKIAPDLVTMLPGTSDAAVAIWQAEAREVTAQARPLSAAQELDLFSGAMN